MPNQGLSETGQIIAAIATAIILALLAKFGLTPNDSEDGPKNNPNIVINVNASGVAEREASQGKEDTRPIDQPAPRPRPQPSPTPRPPAPSPRPPDPNSYVFSPIRPEPAPNPRPPAPSPKPPTPDPKPAPSPKPPTPDPTPRPPPKPPTPPALVLKSWNDLNVGSLPLQNRGADIRANLLGRYRREDTICLTIILNENYDQDVKIAVWGEGPGFTRRSPYGNDWAEMDIERVGMSEGQVYWVAHLPMTTAKFVVLCRTDDAKYAVEPQDAWQYCQSARQVKGDKVKYIMTSNDDLNTFGNFGYRSGPVRLSDMTEDDAMRRTPVIYIPKRNELHVTPEKK